MGEREYPYTYQVIRYVQDLIAGEALNIGVILYAPDVPPYVFARFEHRYERLSDAFAGFDEKRFCRALQAFEASIDCFRANWSDPDAFKPRRSGSEQTLISQLWPDRDISFQASPVMAGIAGVPVVALEMLFTRMVTFRQALRKGTRAPHCCPVCSGCRVLQPGFYGITASSEYETCRTCGGTGVVWEPERPAGGVAEHEAVLRVGARGSDV